MQIKLRKVLALLSCLAMLCTLLPLGAMSVSAATTNLVVNGDFETGDYTGWTKNGMTPTVSAEAAHNGGYGVHLYGTNAWASFNQYIDLEPATTYHISFWYKSASDAAMSVGVELKTKNDSGSYSNKTVFLTSGGQSLSASKSTTTWTQVQSVFTTKDSGDMSHLLTFYRGNGTADATTPSSVYLDDIVLTKLGSGSSNMLQNGGFESTLDPWTQYTSSSQSMALSTDAYTGTNSVIVPFVARSLTVSQVVAVEPNTDYVVTYYYKSLDSNSSTAKNILFGAYSLDAANNGSGVGDLAGAASTLQIANTAWTQGAYMFNSGSNTEVRLAFSGSSSTNPSNRKAMLVDDVVMSKIGGAEPDEPSEPETPAVENLLTNGDFEAGNVGAIPTGWSAQNTGKQYAMTTTAQTHDGSYAAALAYRYTNFVLYQDVEVEANTQYTVTFWYKSTNTSSSTGAAAYLFGVYGNGSQGNTNSNPAGTLIDSTATEVELDYHNSDWTQATYTFNSGANTSVRLAYSPKANKTNFDANSGSEFMYVDDIVMVEGIVEPEEPEVPVEPEVPTYGDLVNGDFEGNGGWTVSGGVIETIDGDKALKGTTTGTSQRYATVAEQTIAVKANTDYTLTLNTKYVGSNSGAMARVHVYKGATGNTEALDATNTYYWNIGANTWEGKQLLFNAGEETTVRILIQQHCAPNTATEVNGNIYFDDFVVAEVKEDVGYVGSYPETMTAGADIRFMTYNVLVGQDETNGGYNWGTAITGRPEKACAMINYYKPDVIALEEFSGEWYDYFVANMPDYAFGEMTSADSQNNGKLYTCLAYNTDTIEKVSTDLKRMTKSRWGTQGMRYLNIATFKVKATGEQFIACATHPDAGDLTGTEDLNGDGVAAEGSGYWRQFQLAEVAGWLADLSANNQMPVICGGDFNASGAETASYGHIVDAGFTDATAGRYIDHIFYNGMATHLYETTVADAAVSGASDHNAVFADIQFLDEFATPIKDAKDYIKTQGRNQLKDGALWLDFSASGIEFSANCEGKVALNLNVKSLKQTDSYGGLYFTVIVDGVKKDRAECHITSTGNVELVLAENLPAGNHTFEVYRQTEHRGAEVGITSIVMNGTFNEKPADNRLYIEFIGDSISTGFGALGTTSDSDGGSPKWQDATVAYPYLTAKALGADFSDVCYSGIGAKYGYQNPNMHTFYPYQRYQYDQTTQYGFTRQPDVVVIALGTNDIANQTDAALRKVGYQELLDLVRSKNPNSKIVWIYGMMKDDDNTMIAELIEENGGAAEGLYSLELVTNTAGAGWHPSAAGQQKFADDLVAFLNSDVLVKYVGDDMLDNDEGCVISSEGTSRMEMTADKLGLAFRFKILADGIEVINDTEAVLDNATIDAFGDGESYKLLRMGAIVTNAPGVGLADMKLADVDGKKTLDINAKYLCDLEGDSAQFAVRITNIPLANEDTILYARAYYVFEYEGREVVVYDDTQSANYINKYDSNDGVLEW